MARWSVDISVEITTTDTMSQNEVFRLAHEAGASVGEVDSVYVRRINEPQ